MVNLTASIAIPNLTKYQVIAFDLISGAVTVRLYYGPGTTRAHDMVCLLADAPTISRGIAQNLAPVGVEDDLVPQLGTFGVCLTNAIAAYRGAANHAAGLKALELRGLTDGWIPAVLAGT